MMRLSTRLQVVIGAVLIALLVLTRGHHFASLQHALPSASWAVFFLAGVYLRPTWMLPLLLGIAATIDYTAITWGGVDSFCVSPAYVALLPAYGSLWLAGRWYANRHRAALVTLVSLAASTFAGTLICEVISSGSFYFYSGRFADPTLGGFAVRLGEYFPASLASTGFWVGVAALIHVIAALSSSAKRATRAAP